MSFLYQDIVYTLDVRNILHVSMCGLDQQTLGPIDPNILRKIEAILTQ
jgi:hypothetical protein